MSKLPKEFVGPTLSNLSHLNEHYCENQEQDSIHPYPISSQVGSEVISTSSIPGIGSQTSQDSGFLSTPSYDSNNYTGCFNLQGNTTCGNRMDDFYPGDDAPSEHNGLIDSSGDIPSVFNDLEEVVNTTCNGRIGQEIGEHAALLENVESFDIQSSKISYISKDLLEEIGVYADSLVNLIMKDVINQNISLAWNIQCSGQCSEIFCREILKKESLEKRTTLHCPKLSCSSNLSWTPELPYSPSHSKASRLSSVSCSHDSLVVGTLKDDSNFIKEAVSHEVLPVTVKKARRETSEVEIYSCPVDTLKPYHRKIFQPKAIVQQPKPRYIFPIGVSSVDTAVGQNGQSLENGEVSKRGKNRDKKSRCESGDAGCQKRFCRLIPLCYAKQSKKLNEENKRTRRKSVTRLRNAIMALFSFRKNPKELGSCVSAENEFINASQIDNTDAAGNVKWGKICPLPSAPPLQHSSQSAFSNPTKFQGESGDVVLKSQGRRSANRPVSLTRPRRERSEARHSRGRSEISRDNDNVHLASMCRFLLNYRRITPRHSRMRALPPVPGETKPPPPSHKTDDEGCDFASIIEKVKDYGWYWGPISGEAAEKVLSNEPDGSFIVRDSSDHHYIFSLTFRLNGFTRHVRIEHNHGNFSFGGFTRFKSQTIVDFIEKAVEHSRSGRYLFFLHRRPVLGPMRVQLLHPVSRHKHVQSLQHLCRFVIVKNVRRDLLDRLPIPHRIKQYLNSPHYYSELVEQCMNMKDEDSLDNFLQRDGVSGSVSSDDPRGAVSLSPHRSTRGVEPVCSFNNYIHHQFTRSSNVSNDNRELPRGVDLFARDVTTGVIVAREFCQDDSECFNSHIAASTEGFAMSRSASMGRIKNRSSSQPHSDAINALAIDIPNYNKNACAGKD